VKVGLDASAAFIIITDPIRVAEAIADATEFIAPDLIVAETLDIRWKTVRARLPAPSVSALLGLFARLRIVMSEPYAAAAAALAERLDHSVSDCLYAVLADRESAILLCADRRFSAQLDGNVRFID
jgi:predicted nucleic acid-binding protein